MGIKAVFVRNASTNLPATNANKFVFIRDESRVKKPADMELEEIPLVQFGISLAIVGNWNDKFIIALAGGTDVVENGHENTAIIICGGANFFSTRIAEMACRLRKQVESHPIANVRIDPTAETERVFVRRAHRREKAFAVPH